MFQNLAYDEVTAERYEHLSKASGISIWACDKLLVTPEFVEKYPSTFSVGEIVHAGPFHSTTIDIYRFTAYTEMYHVRMGVDTEMVVNMRRAYLDSVKDKS